MIPSIGSTIFWSGMGISIFIKLPVGYRYLLAGVLFINQRLTIEILKDKCNVLENKLNEFAQEVENARTKSNHINASTKTNHTNINVMSKQIRRKQPIPEPIIIPSWN